jgi:hypothetical protein
MKGTYETTGTKVDLKGSQGDFVPAKHPSGVFEDSTSLRLPLSEAKVFTTPYNEAKDGERQCDSLTVPLSHEASRGFEGASSIDLSTRASKQHKGKGY